MIGSDGGLLSAPVTLDRTYFAPAERVDLWLDLSNVAIGETVSLESLPLVEGRGNSFPLLKFKVAAAGSGARTLPQNLSSIELLDESQAVNAAAAKKFELYAERGKGWTINGETFSMTEFKDYEIIKLNDVEIWEFYNPTGMPHPMHIHGSQFQVLSRASGPLTGALDYGWKDCVVVLPQDRVRVIKRFGSHKGTFIYHCHNLEHEDMSMMRNYKIT